MSLAVLSAIQEKRRGFGPLNKIVTKGHVPSIVRNYREIRGREFNQSIIYRQAGRDDYEQPSWLEHLFMYWAATSFRSETRGELLLAEVDSWSGWRQGFNTAPYVLPAFWDLEESVDTLMTRLRRSHMSGDVYTERMVLIEMKQKIETMLSITGAEVTNV